MMKEFYHLSVTNVTAEMFATPTRLHIYPAVPVKGTEPRGVRELPGTIKNGAEMSTQIAATHLIFFS